jgi:hypothetical protein
MTDWDPATIDASERGTDAFLVIMSALCWAVCLPFDLCARLRDRRGAEGDPQDDGADCFGAVEGGQLHNGEV